MTTRRAILAICSATVFALAVTQAPAFKHSHKTIQVFRDTPIFTSPGQVGSGIAFCPSGTIATGGGEDFVTGLATIDMGFSGSDAYYAIVDNFDSTLPSQVNVQVACTAGTTRARGRALTRAQVQERVAGMAAAREALHRAAEK